MEEQTHKTPKEDLRKEALQHYDELSTKCHHYSNSIPRAINFYYDYHGSVWFKILKALKLIK